MKKQGGNGTVFIDSESNTATKVLSNPKNQESKKRFIYEMSVLQKVKKESLDAIVEIKHIDKENMQIVMKAYETNLESIYEETRGNVKKTICMILPIVKALKVLSELDTPIYHRDIKPQNILVDKTEEGNKLVLADFGCAYMEDSFDERLTDDFRAVGAQLYRAPEYQYGRVESVDEKGDIFSIGKVIWNLVNGKPREVFPYTLWFPREYNICNRFPNTIELLKINNLIASCVNYDKSKRPTYQEMIDEMNSIISDKDEIDIDMLKQKAVEFEARRVLVDLENQEKNIMFLEVFFHDFGETIVGLEMLGLELINRIRGNYFQWGCRKDEIIQHIIRRGEEFHLVNMGFQGVYFQISYRPKTDVTALLNKPGVNRNYPYIHTFYGGGQVKRNSMSIFYNNGLLYYEMEDGQMERYSDSVWKEYMEEFINRYMQ